MAPSAKPSASQSHAPSLGPFGGVNWTILRDSLLSAIKLTDMITLPVGLNLCVVEGAGKL